MSSNFPNMSYCAFENTAKSMDQVANMLQEAINEGKPLDLSRCEQRPYLEMWEKCRWMMELLEQHEELVGLMEEPEDEVADPGDMDGDHESALASAGLGLDESYE